MTVVDAGVSRIKLMFEPEASVRSYELLVKSETAGSFGNSCDKDRGRCVVDNLRPGVNYIATLAHCYESNPIQCIVQARQLAVSTKPTGNTFFITEYSLRGKCLN